MHLPNQQPAMLAAAAAAAPAAECDPMPTTTSCLPSQTQADLISKKIIMLSAVATSASHSMLARLTMLFVCSHQPLITNHI
jgi:hypothetical protein